MSFCLVLSCNWYKDQTETEKIITALRKAGLPD
jgi:hypothetical protein